MTERNGRVLISITYPPVVLSLIEENKEKEINSHASEVSNIFGTSSKLNRFQNEKKERKILFHILL